MIILGISSNYHDASATLIKDSKVIASSTEERFSRRKHDPNFPVEAIQFCLKQSGLTGKDIDYVAYHEDPATKFTRSMSTAFTNWPFSLKTFLKSAEEAITGSLSIDSKIVKELDVSANNIVHVPHHMSHAAHGFLTSGFDSALVVTIDAVGEWISSTIFHGYWKEGAPVLEPLDIAPFPHSLGLVYSAVTAYLGFKVNDAECSTMALAAFGRPNYADEVKKIIRLKPDGSYDVDLTFFDFSSNSTVPVTEKFTSRFGPIRSIKDPIEFDIFNPQKKISPDQQRLADVACSVQMVLQEAIVNYVKLGLSLKKEKNLCYSGGVAFNCVANKAILDLNIFENLYIPPDPGDGGGSMGAALYLAGLKKGLSQKFNAHPFLGAEAKETEIADVWNYLHPESWHLSSRLITKEVSAKKLRLQKFDDQHKLILRTSELIVSGKIVGWVQGRAENGPRALGHRSILIRPDDLEVVNRLSKTIKLRASFRPYALSMTEATAQKILMLETDKIPLVAKWMQSSFAVKPEFAKNFIGGIHVDGTTRPQVICKNEIPLFEMLLVQVGLSLGHECLLNTSLNETNTPLVTTATDALIFFARTPIDALVINSILIERL